MTPHRPYPPDWLDDEGAAYLLSIPVSTFRDYVAAGTLPQGAKIGKHRRWAREALNEALAAMADPSNATGIGRDLMRLAHGQAAKGGRHAA